MRHLIDAHSLIWLPLRVYADRECGFRIRPVRSHPRLGLTDDPQRAHLMGFLRLLY
jgi:hypothetical protein